MSQAQDTVTVTRLRAIAEDETLSHARLRVILKGLAESFYHASYGDLVCRETDVATVLASSISADFLQIEDRVVRMN